MKRDWLKEMEEEEPEPEGNEMEEEWDEKLIEKKPETDPPAPSEPAF